MAFHVYAVKRYWGECDGADYIAFHRDRSRAQAEVDDLNATVDKSDEYAADEYVIEMRLGMALDDDPDTWVVLGRESYVLFSKGGEGAASHKIHMMDTPNSGCF